MALATTCPACSTSFKVNPEQLKLRRGLVRCGMCQHVFSGVEYLRYVSDLRADSGVRPGADAIKPRIDPAQQADIEADSLPADAQDDDGPATIPGDLKTAFFLPETRFRPAPAEPSPSIADDLHDIPPLQSDARAGDGPAGQSGADADPVDRRADGATQEPGSLTTPSGDDLEIDTIAAGDSPGPRVRRNGRRRNRGRNRQRRHKAGQVDGSDSVAGMADDSQTIPPVLDGAADRSNRPPHDAANGALDGGGKADEANRSARAAPTIWPSIVEDFDEPDIQAPDTVPVERGDGKGHRSGEPAQGRAGDDRSDQSRTAAIVRALAGDDQPAKREPGAARAGATSGADGEIAIDYFNETSRPSFNFDLPSRHAWIGAAVLSIILALQLVLGARESIAARFPALRAPLSSFAAPFGLAVDLPWDTTSVKIRSFELAAESNQRNNSRFTMIMLLGNEARHSMKWPAVELTLTNSIGEILVRKVILPDQYVTDAVELANGIAANSEKVIRVNLQADQIYPVGYSAVLFHP